MAIQLAFESIASVSSIKERAEKNAEVLKVRGQIRKLQIERSARIMSVLKTLFPPPKNPKAKVEMNLDLSSLRIPHHLDLSENEKTFQWQNGDGLPVEMSGEEHELQVVFERMDELLLNAQGLLKGIEYTKTKADIAQRRTERDLDYIEHMTGVAIKIDDAFTLHDAAGTERFIAENVSDNNKVMVGTLLRTQQIDRTNDLQAIKAGRGLPDLRNMEQFLNLNQAEKDELKKLAEEKTFDLERLKKLEPTLQSLVNRAEAGFQQLQLPVPAAGKQSDELKKLLDDPILCTFIPSEPRETDYASMFAIAGLVVLAVSATVVGLKMTAKPSTQQTAPHKGR